MTTREEALACCLALKNTASDQPFRDPGWTAVRRRENRKIFALIFERNGQIWINVKVDPEWRDFWRSAFPAVVPAYHMNKEHWNSIILDGSVPEKDIRRMIGESYDLVGKTSGGKRIKCRSLPGTYTTPWLPFQRERWPLTARSPAWRGIPGRSGQWAAFSIKIKNRVCIPATG